MSKFVNPSGISINKCKKFKLVCPEPRTYPGSGFWREIANISSLCCNWLLFPSRKILGSGGLEYLIEFSCVLVHCSFLVSEGELQRSPWRNSLYCVTCPMGTTGEWDVKSISAMIPFAWWISTKHQHRFTCCGMFCSVLSSVVHTKESMPTTE